GLAGAILAAIRFGGLPMKRQLAMGVSLATLILAAACTTNTDKPAATAASAPHPQYGTWGFDSAGADTATKPGDDFFRYANGTWIDKTEIPADKAAYTLRLAMTDAVEQRMHQIMDAAAAKAAHEPNDLEGKVGAFYKSFLDEATVEKL